MDLAIALLRGGLRRARRLNAHRLHEWLKKICPICLQMIEAAQSKRRQGAEQ